MKTAEMPVLNRDSGAIAPPLYANRVLRNTYWLLSLTLLFSAGVADMTAALQLPHPGIIITLIGYFGLLFLTTSLLHLLGFTSSNEFSANIAYQRKGE